MRIGASSVAFAVLVVWVASPLPGAEPISPASRFSQGVCGELVALNLAGKPATVTVRLETEAELCLDIAESATVHVAFASAQLSDLKPAQQISLRLAADQRTVAAIHAEGEVREVRIRSVDVTGRKLFVEPEDAEDEAASPATPAEELSVSAAAVIEIGELPAKLADLPPGTVLPVELGADGKTVQAILAEGDEGALVSGPVLEVDLAAKEIKVTVEVNEQESVATYGVSELEGIVLDGKPTALAALKAGSEVRLRLAADKATVQALAATSAEAEDEDE